MLKRIPSIGTPISSASIARGIGGGGNAGRFSGSLRESTGRKYCLLTGSGTTALFLILRALRSLAHEFRSEVVMPAYTAPSLVLALREAGTYPVLTEVSDDTFNQDLRLMAQKVSERTLAVMPVHMYGLVGDLTSLTATARTEGVFVVEDAASAQGSSVSGRPAGSMGDVSFFSFNRGKNLSTVAGGAVLTDREDIFEAVRDEEKKLASPDGQMRLHMLMKAIGLSLIWRPSFYSLLWPIARGYKYDEPHPSIELLSCTDFQAGLGCSLMERRNRIFSRRYENGAYLFDSLRSSNAFKLPRIAPDAYTVFNQFPVLIEPSRKAALCSKLNKAGFEATVLYPLPIHRIYDLGYRDDPDPFPGASRIASELLLLPVHPGVSRNTVSRMLEVIIEDQQASGEERDTDQEC